MPPESKNKFGLKPARVTCAKVAIKNHFNKTIKFHACLYYYVLFLQEFFRSAYINPYLAALLASKKQVPAANLNFDKFSQEYCFIEKKHYFCSPNVYRNIFARMAESVDALVSNTNGRKAVPVRPRLRVLVKEAIV